MSEDGFRVPAWHAQHPRRSEAYPLCGTVNLRGRPTHRVVKAMNVTCAKCLKALKRTAEMERAVAALSDEPPNAGAKLETTAPAQK